MVKLSKDKFNAIEGAFLMLKEVPLSVAPLKVIKKSLEECFDYTFNVNIVTPENGELFVMSIYPEISIIDKIIAIVSDDKQDLKAVKTLWEKNKVWTIEIDGRLLNNNIIECNEKELTAMLLHEIGHVIYSNSITSRISTILKYEIIKTSMKNKSMIKDKIFRRIMSLPVLDACISDASKSKDSIKEEIKADDFCKKMGYKDELFSVLTKLSKNNKYPRGNSINSKIVKTANFSLKTLENFQQRRENLAKHDLSLLKESCNSPYIKEVINDYIQTVFEDSNDSNSIINGRKIQIMQERADKVIEDNYFTEFFIFGTKELKRIDPSEIDYIQIKIQEMKTENDKMMIVSYIHSKIDLVEYYISILENPKYAKKYSIPHTLPQLYGLKKHLYNLRNTALNFKLPEKKPYGIQINWAKGYEG